MDASLPIVDVERTLVPDRATAARRVRLVAIQAELYGRHYAGAETFAIEIEALAERALEGVDVGDVPTLLAFPEAIGLPLPFVLADRELAAAVVAGAPLALPFARALGRRARRWIPNLFRAGIGAVWSIGALEADALMREVFGGIARRYAVSVAAGSAPLPLVDDEAARGVHVRRARVRNTAYLFGPEGRLLDRTEKVVPTALERRVGIRPGSLADLGVVSTPVGRVGTAICLDAFHRSVLEHLDAAGAEIVLQPSANLAPWDRPWPPDPRRREGEAWLDLGLRAGVRDRRAIRIGVNPMLVGDVGPLHPRGRSTIVVDPRLVRHDGRTERAGADGGGGAGVLAIAPESTRGAILRASVTLPEPADRSGPPAPDPGAVGRRFRAGASR